jgi:hypothetical protein
MNVLNSDFKRVELNRLRLQLKPEQSDFLDRIYSNGIKDEQLDNAIRLCQATIRKNNL